MKIKFRNEGFFDKFILEEEILKMAMEFHEKILEFVKDPHDEDALILGHNKFVKFLANSTTNLHRNIYGQIRMDQFGKLIEDKAESWLCTKTLMALKQLLEVYYGIGLKPKDFVKVRKTPSLIIQHFLIDLGLAGEFNFNFF